MLTEKLSASAGYTTADLVHCLMSGPVLQRRGLVAVAADVRLSHPFRMVWPCPNIIDSPS